MRRTDFDGVIKHFVNTIGAENGNIQFYKMKYPIENMGMTGGKLEKYKCVPAIILIEGESALHNQDGKQASTIKTSCRSAAPDLLNTYFYYKNKRYKIIDKKNIEGRTSNVDFFHYGCVEG